MNKPLASVDNFDANFDAVPNYATTQKWITCRQTRGSATQVCQLWLVTSPPEKLLSLLSKRISRNIETIAEFIISLIVVVNVAFAKQNSRDYKTVQNVAS